MHNMNIKYHCPDARPASAHYLYFKLRNIVVNKFIILVTGIYILRYDHKIAIYVEIEAERYLHG